MTTPPPRWITPFFYCATIAALAAVVMAFIWHDSERPDFGEQAVADITINLGGKPVREHCVTCHVDGSRPVPSDLAQKASPHPDISPHRIEKLGCTGCHLGEGMALDMKISHGLPGLGARQVLSGKDTQASCFKCHLPSKMPGAEHAWHGYRLFFIKACNTCHSINSARRTGFFGPDLSRVGSTLGLDQLQEAIREPRESPINSTMPRFPLSKKQARQISYFLKSLTGEPFYATPMEIQSGKVNFPEVDLLPKGQTLTDLEQRLHKHQCLACHKFGESDGRIGPDLTYTGLQRGRDYLKKSIRNLASLIPDSAMPGIPLPPEEEDRLVQLLQEHAVGLIEGKQLLSSDEPAAGASGKHLYMRFCQRCHAAEGDGRGPIQPNLANFPRAFVNNAAFFTSVSDERLIKSVRSGVPGTSMPGYEKILTPSQTGQVLDLIFVAFIGLDRSEKKTQVELPEKPESRASAQSSHALFIQNCSRCHGAHGTGKGPEHLEYVPRPRNLRNKTYFSGLTDQRIARAIHDGVPGTAMPGFRAEIDGTELWALVDKVRTFSEPQEP